MYDVNRFQEFNVLYLKRKNTKTLKFVKKMMNRKNLMSAWLLFQTNRGNIKPCSFSRLSEFSFYFIWQSL